ncbi:paraquat-inducible protein A [Endozoicomonas elysicola]|uniref:paraquat-inducible protein A n=1 Tax=Endozoicomonas elysicola TaxID=305900 RepID=UPI0003A4C9F4|nr:paraquat-inducible protein A [Endozoicomonas elysicola]
MENEAMGKALGKYLQALLTQRHSGGREAEQPHELLCPECDLLISIPVLKQRQVAACPRCFRTLEKHAYYRIQTLLALVITGLLLYIPANIYPVLTLELAGRQHSSTIWGGVVALWRNGLPIVATVVFVFVILVPLLRLIMLLPIIWASLLRDGSRFSRSLFRDYLFLCQWGMAKIYMLGVLISAVKLVDMATVEAGLGVFCYTGLMLIEIAISITLNEAKLWIALGRDAGAKVVEGKTVINEWY